MSRIQSPSGRHSGIAQVRKEQWEKPRLRLLGTIESISANGTGIDDGGPVGNARS